MQENRLQFIDLFRGWIILIMIEVHVFNDTLHLSLKNTTWFNLLNFINGMVAPSFLFITGYIFVYKNLKKENLFFQLNSDFWKIIFRIIMLLIIGYLLHFPFDSFSQLLLSKPEQWVVFYQSDILHCIAVGWFILLLTHFIIKKINVYQWLLLFLTLLFITTSIYLWQISFPPHFFTAYLNAQISLFPIFPWLAFLFMGGFFGCIYFKIKKYAEQKKENLLFKYNFILGAVLLLSGCILFFYPFTLNQKVNPFFFLVRLGVIMICMSAFWFYEKKRGIHSKILILAGQESLFIYVAHLLVLYTAIISGKKLTEIFAQQFNFWQASLATLILICSMLIIAQIWHKIKIKQRLKKYFSVGFICSILLLFFIR